MVARILIGLFVCSLACMQLHYSRHSISYVDRLEVQKRSEGRS